MWGDNYTFPDEDLPDSVTLPCGCVVEVQWLHTMASGLVGCVASRATICGERHKSSIEKMARDVAREMYESRMEWLNEAKSGVKTSPWSFQPSAANAGDHVAQDAIEAHGAGAAGDGVASDQGTGRSEG